MKRLLLYILGLVIVISLDYSWVIVLVVLVLWLVGWTAMILHYLS
jgi:hypothetical protein